MKKNNKKGFTIVELVIVIAVIAILAAVLIPTFANVIARANENSAMQAARNAYTNWLAEDQNTENMSDNYDFSIKSGDYYFEIVNGQFNSEASNTAKSTLVAEVSGEKLNGVVVVTAKLVKESEDWTGDKYAAADIGKVVAYITPPPAETETETEVETETETESAP